jgi:hypothetical protein
MNSSEQRWGTEAARHRHIARASARRSSERAESWSKRNVPQRAMEASELAATHPPPSVPSSLTPVLPGRRLALAPPLPRCTLALKLCELGITIL